MKIILPLVVVGILFLSGFGAVIGSQNDDVSYRSERVILSTPILVEQEHYTQINSVEASTYCIESGKPALPVVTKTFTFPLGTRIENVDVIFSPSISHQISKPIKPAPTPQILCDVSTETKRMSQESPVTYSDIDIYPETRFTYRMGTGLTGNERVLILNVYLHPVQYNPSENMIFYSEQMDIHIDYKIPEQQVNIPDEYDLLVLTPSDFYDQFFVNDIEFDVSFVDYKNDKGIKTQVVTLEEIYDGTYFSVNGIDEQEKIKYFIKDAIENWGIENVILVGAGVEDEEIFPVRQAWIGSGQYERYFPSDLYYADIYDANMSFSDWDADDNEKYAEYRNSLINDMDDVDMYPDVHLGRLPCNNLKEVEDVIHKILYYEMHNEMTNKIVQIGGDTFPGDGEGINEGEYANGVVLDLLDGYTTTQLWASNDMLTKKNIADGFKSSVDFVDFSGHGSWAAWSTHATNDDETWLPDSTFISRYTGFLYIDFDIYQINNQYKFPVVVLNACSCNKFSEHESCLGWTVVKRPNGGGIASFGASGIGYGSYGTSEVERVFGWMAVHLFEELYNTKNLGQVWSNVLTGYINTFEFDDIDYKTVLEMTMFGDPTVVIDDGEEPKTDNAQIQLPLLQRIIDHYPSRFTLLKHIQMIFG